jgi:hypothetical protein
MRTKSVETLDAELHIKQTAFKLVTDSEFVKGAILELCRRQTDMEFATRSTQILNRVGFNKPDAAMFTEIGSALRQGAEPSPEILLRLGHRLVKYSRQIAEAFPP